MNQAGGDDAPPLLQHGFDMLDHDDDSRHAVETALDGVVRLLG